MVCPRDDALSGTHLRVPKYIGSHLGSAVRSLGDGVSKR